METMIRATVLAATVVLIAGCSSTWETTEPVAAATTQASEDTVPRTAGKLRRLILLPPVFEMDTADCATRLNVSVESNSQMIHDAAKQFLVDWKGYEVIEAGTHLPEADARALVRELGIWQEASAADRIPPEALRAPVQTLARNLRADGAIVLHAAPECINWVDVTLNLLAVGMPNFYGKMFGRNFSAGIYEAATGSLVWQHYVNVPMASPGCVRSGACIDNRTQLLLGTLENAVPAALVK